MSEPSDKADEMYATCDAVLREIAGYPITPERLSAALPLIKDILSAVRSLDEVDIGNADPMTTFRPLR